MHKTYWIFIPNIFLYFVYKECSSLNFLSEICQLLIFYWADMSLVFVRERSFWACPKVDRKFDSFYPKLGEPFFLTALLTESIYLQDFIFTWFFWSGWPKGSGICTLLPWLPYHPKLFVCKPLMGKRKVSYYE